MDSIQNVLGAASRESFTFYFVDELLDLDPWSLDLTDAQKSAIFNRCKSDPGYMSRRVIRSRQPDPLTLHAQSQTWSVDYHGQLPGSFSEFGIIDRFEFKVVPAPDYQKEINVGHVGHYCAAELNPITKILRGTSLWSWT